MEPVDIKVAMAWTVFIFLSIGILDVILLKPAFEKVIKVIRELKKNAKSRS